MISVKLIIAALANRAGYAKAKFDAGGMFFQRYADISMTTIGWTAVYNETLKGLDVSTPEARAAAKAAAVKAADKALRESQPNTNAWASSPAFRSGSGLVKALTRMGLPANKLLNMWFRVPKAIREGRTKQVIAFAAGQAITSLALAALLGKLGDDDDDEKDKALKIAYWTMLDPLMATIPFGVAQSDIQWAVERMVTGEKDYKYSPQMIPLLNTFTQFAVDAKELNTNRLVDDAVGLLGYGFGLPRTQALRIMKATENAEDPIEWAARAFGAQDWYD